MSTSISLRTREFAMLRSVGMIPKGFNKMIQYESIFYGVNALVAYQRPRHVWHSPLRWLTFEYEFQLPRMSILFVIVMIFIILFSLFELNVIAPSVTTLFALQILTLNTKEY